MQKNILQLILGFIAFATAFGVVLHDTQLDKATTVAIAMPAIAMGYAAADVAIKSSDAHIHVERVSLSRYVNLRSSLPRLNPKDDERFVHKEQKVAFIGPSSSNSLWPSI
jgi:hypothetical protein